MDNRCPRYLSVQISTIVWSIFERNSRLCDATARWIQPYTCRIHWRRQLRKPFKFWDAWLRVYVSRCETSKSKPQAASSCFLILDDTETDVNLYRCAPRTNDLPRDVRILHNPRHTACFSASGRSWWIWWNCLFSSISRNSAKYIRHQRKNCWSWERVGSRWICSPSHGILSSNNIPSFPLNHSTFCCSSF